MLFKSLRKNETRCIQHTEKEPDLKYGK